MKTIYYLDTTIQLSKLFAPQNIRNHIKDQIEIHTCVTSRYVLMEYLRWLEPSIHLHQLLQEEIDRDPITALSEVQARILLTFGRQQNKMFTILMWLCRYYNHNIWNLFLQLERLIEGQFKKLFYKDINELSDSIACPLMDLHAILENTNYRLEPNIPYRQGQMPCYIATFLNEHRLELKALSEVLNAAYPKMAEACRRVLSKPEDAQGNICKTLGDIIIALQTPDEAILWTTDASFALICPTLGIRHFREPLSG